MFQNIMKDGKLEFIYLQFLFFFFCCMAVLAKSIIPLHWETSKEACGFTV